MDFSWYDYEVYLIPKNRLKRQGLPIQNKVRPTFPKAPTLREHVYPDPATYDVNYKPAYKSPPAFSFGIKPKPPKSKFIGPAPTDYNVFGLIAKGKLGIHGATLKSRPKSPSLRYSAPGPADYSPEYTLGGPSFSLRKRLYGREGNDNPAPDAFRLPPMIGPTKDGRHPKAPAYVMTGRPLKFGRLATPGPADYSPSHKWAIRHAPAYTFGRRLRHSKTEYSPGPASYAAHKVYVEKKYPPDFSFGQKSSKIFMELRAQFNNEPIDSWKC